MINIGVVISAIVSLIERLADLLIQWRISQGSKVTGVGSIIDRVEAVVDDWAIRVPPTELVTKKAVDDWRRDGVTQELKTIGVDVAGKYIRWLIESVLIRKDTRGYL